MRWPDAQDGISPAAFWGNAARGATNECWLWTGPKCPEGRYGKYHSTSAHRVAYQLEVGPIGPGLEIDHLCNNGLCVNPAHMEPVTHAENMRRRVQRRTRCKWGHLYTPENTRVWRNVRLCRACARRRSAERKVH